jgi:hypothetical protein
MLDACFFLSADDLVAVTVQRGDQDLTFKVQACDPPGHQRLHETLGSTDGLRIGQ